MYVTNPFGAAGYGVFGRHAGVDLRAAVGTNVLAPADGIITERYVGSAGIQVLSMRIGNYEHRFLHLSSMYPLVGERVKQGQLIAKSGNTGNVAAHLHWDVRTAGTAWNRSFSDYINPLTLLQGGEMATRTQVNNLYKAILHRDGDAGGLDNYTGKDANVIVSEMLNSQEFKNHQAYLTAVTKQVTDLQTALTNEKNKPPVQVIKEVDRIVEKIVKVEVPVEIVKEIEPKWLTATVNFIRSVLKIK
jgi:uncharacterized protein YaaR (DUF327 family)